MSCHPNGFADLEEFGNRNTVAPRVVILNVLALRLERVFLAVFLCPLLELLPIKLVILVEQDAMIHELVSLEAMQPALTSDRLVRPLFHEDVRPLCFVGFEFEGDALPVFIILILP